MEEDDEDMRADLVVWAPAVDEMWTPSSLINQREQLFQRMRYRAVVSRACCEVIMSNTNPSHPVWKKHRHPAHAGAYPRHYFSTRSLIPTKIKKKKNYIIFFKTNIFLIIAFAEIESIVQIAYWRNRRNFYKEI